MKMGNIARGMLRRCSARACWRDAAVCDVAWTKEVG
eukprot:CAMPEP_0170249266 /NCGR_PEP_ID=MMETSP0116_2-20130129/24436_1 /TAXON_ID=400756 /ORGANISM="Durinskia baltica, Strain CSIRO CS-38" /LENGTH=35 /DNA_ID= /DNA_START= /DNA_END= /DNA_ORIENTATION=